MPEPAGAHAARKQRLGLRTTGGLGSTSFGRAGGGRGGSGRWSEDAVGQRRLPDAAEGGLPLWRQRSRGHDGINRGSFTRTHGHDVDLRFGECLIEVREYVVHLAVHLCLGP